MKKKYRSDEVAETTGNMTQMRGNGMWEEEGEEGEEETRKR